MGVAVEDASPAVISSDVREAAIAVAQCAPAGATCRPSTPRVETLCGSATA